MALSTSSEIKSSTPLLITGFIVMISLVMLFALIALHENSKIAELNDKIYRHPFSVSNAVLEANSDIIAMHRYMKDVVLAVNQEELEIATSLVDFHEQKVYRHFALIKERFLGDMETVNTAFSAFVGWKTIRNEVISLQRANRHKEAAAITVGKGANHVQLLTQRMNILIYFARNKALEFRDNSQKSYDDGKSYLYALLIFILFSGVSTALFVVTQIRKAEEQLQLSSRVFSDTSEGITVTDANKMIVDVNPAFCKITGYSREEVIGRNPGILSSGKQKPEFYALMWQQINKSGHWQGEIWNRKKNGEMYAELLTISSLNDSNDKVVNYVGVFTDITRSKLQQKDMELMAHYDALTKLPNRTLLRDRFNQALARTKRADVLLAVCFLDLDDFKLVNDKFGHEMGDKLLIEVARRLESSVRDEDTVSRLGGDEFSLLLGDIKSTAKCYEFLERIIQSVSATYFIDEKAINISASIGASLCPLDGVELDVLLRHADQAMYQAKQEGKNNYRFFDVNEAKTIAHKQQQLQEIEHALLAHELCLHYQPKVNMLSGKLIGLEALIRWEHPDKGLIPPIEFLPVIEGLDLEVQIGDWVIEQGLTQLELLNNRGIEIEISVNVSSAQFLDPSFFDNLNDALERHHNINPRYFQLEVLESSVLSNLEEISSIINRCRNELSISIALDDFGTGYSSLSHLTKLPADTIKIDQSFVRDVLDDPDDFAIIDGIIGLADSFNRHVIAEGVETTKHGLMLLLMGCNDVQGYAISKPLPEGELLDWINNFSPNQTWIENVQENMTPQERRVKQLILMLNHWLEKIDRFLLNGTEEQLEMESVKCHFGKWIRRLRQDHLFKAPWLDQLQQAHDVMHFVANELVDSHATGKNPTKNELDRLHIAFNKILLILSQY